MEQDKIKSIDLESLLSKNIKLQKPSNEEALLVNRLPTEVKDFIKQIGNPNVVHYVQELNKILTKTPKEIDSGWKETAIGSTLLMIAGLIVVFFTGAYLSVAVATLCLWLFLIATKLHSDQREVFLRTKINELKIPLSLTESKVFYLTVVREKIKDFEPELKNQILKSATEYFGFKSFDTKYDYTNLPVLLDTKFKEVALFIEGEIAKNNHGLTKEELTILTTISDNNNR